MSAEINSENKAVQEDKELQLQNLKIDEGEEKNVKPEEDIAKPEDKEKYLKLVKRFLHYASEYPVYTPGDRFYFKHFIKSKFTSLAKLIQLESPENIINLIIKVKQDGTSVYPDSLVFALALCTIYDKRPLLQCLAYNALKTICPKPREFFLFVKFTKELNVPYGKGGRGWKRAISSWYDIWTPFDLSQIFIQHKRHFGWTHKDVFKLTHMKPTTAQKKMLILYALRGHDEAIAKFGTENDSFIQEMITYLTEWKHFTSETNITEAAKKLEDEVYPLDIVPCRLLKEEAIWNVILPRMEIKELVHILHRLASFGFLRNSSRTSQILIDSLDNFYSKQNCELRPCEVYIALRQYQLGPKMSLTWEQLKRPGPPSGGPETKQPPKLNPAIEKALVNLSEDLFKMSKPTNKSYLITLDSRAKRKRCPCHHCPYVDVDEAGQLIAKTITAAESEENVTVITFDNKGRIHKLSLNRAAALPTHLYDFKESGGGQADVGRSIQFAVKNKLKIDVFLILSDSLKITKGARNALEQYRIQMEKPDAKLISCSLLIGKRPPEEEVDVDGIFYIHGFDSKVCSVIESFCRGAF